MTKEDFTTKVVAKINSLWTREPLNKEQEVIYGMVLKDFSAQDVLTAVIRLAQVSRYRPLPSEIKDEVRSAKTAVNQTMVPPKGWDG